MASQEEEYVCTLDAKTLKKAEKELGEKPKERLGAVQTLRDWVNQQPHIKCDTNTQFLLRFLRYSKFSQLKARETLEKYLTAMTDVPEWFRDIDIESPGVKAFLKTGYCLYLGTDDEGRRLMIYRMSALDPQCKDYNKSDYFKAVMSTFHTYFYNEADQVNGYIFMFDITGMTLKHQTYFTMDEMKKSTKIFQSSFPSRFKGMHYYNVGAIFEAIFQVTYPLLSKKFKERIKMHSTMEHVYKYIPKKLLPVEYLPDDYKGPNAGSIKDITERMISEINAPGMREKILHMTGDSFGVNKSLKPSDVPNESFRRLQVD